MRFDDLPPIKPKYNGFFFFLFMKITDFIFILIVYNTVIYIYYLSVSLSIFSIYLNYTIHKQTFYSLKVEKEHLMFIE